MQLLASLLLFTRQTEQDQQAGGAKLKPFVDMEVTDLILLALELPGLSASHAAHFIVSVLLEIMQTGQLQPEFAIGLKLDPGEDQLED